MHLPPVTHCPAATLLLFFLLVPAPATAGDTSVTVESPNFLVTAPTAEVAKEFLYEAETCRYRVATQWLGETLPPSVGRSLICVTLSDTEDKAISLVADNRQRLTHTVWITTNRERGTATLAHEIAHAVLATRYPGQLAAWVQEGIASEYDSAARREVRAEILAWYRRTGNWARLERLLTAESIARQDQAAYAAAVSLTAFLLELGDRSQLVEFALAGNEDGWESALEQIYQIDGVAALQVQWQAWVEEQAVRTEASERLAKRERAGIRRSEQVLSAPGG